jgi:hypothetical protein
MDICFFAYCTHRVFDLILRQKSPFSLLDLWLRFVHQIHLRMDGSVGVGRGGECFCWRKLV